jgi:hypothetical protein
MNKPTEEPDQPPVGGPDNVVQLPQGDSVAPPRERPSKLLAPPPKPDRTYLPRLSMTVSEVLDLAELVLRDAVDSICLLYWQEIGESIRLEQPEDLKNVANPRDVGAFTVGVTYSDGTMLELQLSFGKRRGRVDVHGMGEARVRGRAVHHRFASLRRTPQLLLQARSAIFKPGRLSGWVALFCLVPWGVTNGILALTGRGEIVRDSVSGGWASWAIAAPSAIVALLGVELVDRMPKFQLRADQAEARPNWEVRWGAVGALAGIVGIIVALLLR